MTTEVKYIDHKAKLANANVSRYGSCAQTVKRIVMTAEEGDRWNEEFWRLRRLTEEVEKL